MDALPLYCSHQSSFTSAINTPGSNYISSINVSSLCKPEGTGVQHRGNWVNSSNNLIHFFRIRKIKLIPNNQTWLHLCIAGYKWLLKLSINFVSREIGRWFFSIFPGSGDFFYNSSGKGLSFGSVIMSFWKHSVERIFLRCLPLGIKSSVGNGYTMPDDSLKCSLATWHINRYRTHTFHPWWYLCNLFFLLK